jgi:hypothetical protein
MKNDLRGNKYNSITLCYDSKAIMFDNLTIFVFNAFELCC